MNKAEIEFYIRKYLNDTLTEKESQIFFDEIITGQHRAVFEEIAASLMEDQTGSLSFNEKLLPVLERVMQVDVPASEGFTPLTVHRIHFLRRGFLKYAAAIILVTGLGALIWSISNKEKQEKNMMANHAPVKPGREGAILTLGDGTTVLLDSVKNGIVANQQGALATIKDGRLVYEGNAENELYNTMTIPKGRTFQLSLPDGTRIWLNSGSSIKYPVVFAKDKRTVEMKGEAYFEVTKNPNAPFFVNLNNGKSIEVLGTVFNVNAYENEETIKTTLINGSVKVNSTGTTGKILKPGYQAEIKVNDIEVNELAEDEIDKTIAWRDGFFNFDDASLAEVMRQLERWYDIDVVYEKEIPAIHFLGEIPRNTDISDVLTFLEKAHVHFRLEGRKLIVLP